MDLFIGAAITISGILKKMGGKKYVPIEDEEILLRKRIKSLKKEQEVNETEMKLRRRLMELHEKRMELITTRNTRELQSCITELEDGVVLLEHDREVEENEDKMYCKILKESSEIRRELEKFY